MIDLAGELARALEDPRVKQSLREAVKPAVREVLEEREAEALFPGPQAARYVYNRPGAERAWEQLRRRHPEIDRLSIGSGKLRRWRRADLDALIAQMPKLRRARASAERSLRSVSMSEVEPAAPPAPAPAAVAPGPAPAAPASTSQRPRRQRRLPPL